MSSGQPRPKDGDTLPRRPKALKGLAESLGAIGLVSAGVGGVTYVLLVVGCSQLYQPLGVSPDEVGLGRDELLLRTATAVAGASASAIAVLSLMLGIAFVTVKLWTTADNSRAERLMLLVVAFTLIAAWFLAGWLAVGVVLAGWVLLALCWLFGILLGFGKKPAGETRQAPVGDRTPVIAASFGVAILAFAVPGLIMSAVEAAQDLREGRRPDRLFGFRTPWNADVVRPTWADAKGEGPLELPRCLLYLGRSDGISVFYDAAPGHERALRIPSSAVVVEVLPTARSSLPRSAKSRNGRALAGNPSC